MISWEEAKALSANEFGELMLAYIGASMSSQNKKATYKTLAKLIYRSHSRVQTWLSPQSKEPLPLNERHHIYLVVLCMQSQRNWQAEEISYITLSTDNYEDIAVNISRSINAITIKKQELRKKNGVRPIIQINPLNFSDDQKKVLLDSSLSNKQKKEYFNVKSESTILNWKRKLNGITRMN